MGDPLLLIMGLAGQLTDWPQGLVDQLSDAGFRVIRLDNRDAGLSTAFDWSPPSQTKMARSLLSKKPMPLAAGYTLEDMADDAVGLLSELGVASAHMVGASMGGMIAQIIAFRHPERTMSLTSIMSNTGDRRHGLVAPKVLAKIARLKPVPKAEAAVVGTEMYAMFAGSLWDKDLHLERAKASVERSFRPGGTARQNAAILASPDRTADLGTVTAPTLVIHGLEDTLVLPSGGTSTAKAVPGSRLLVFPDMGHDLPEARWPEMVQAIHQNANRSQPAHAN